MQRLGLLHLRQRPYRSEDPRRQLAVDLDQRNGVAAGRFAAHVEGRDVNTGVAERAGEAADEARLVEIGDVDHRWAELRVHADALDVDDARTAVGEHRAGHFA